MRSSDKRKTVQTDIPPIIDIVTVKSAFSENESIPVLLFIGEIETIRREMFQSGGEIELGIFPVY